MLMFAAGMHVPIRQPELVRQLGRGAVAAAIAAVLAVARRDRGHADRGRPPRRRSTRVVLASGSAAVLVPSLDEAGLLDASRRARRRRAGGDRRRRGDRRRAARRSSRTAPSARCSAPLAVAACAAALSSADAGARRRRTGSAGCAGSRSGAPGRSTCGSRCSCSSRSAGSRRGSGTSILIAGFAVGLVVAATGGPKRLSRQVTGVAQGFFVPLFFVVLGARIDIRALGTDGVLIELAVLLVAFDVAARLAAALLTRQPAAAGLAATVQLGVPAAVVALGLTLGVVSPGAGAAIMVAALVSIGISGAGVSLLQRLAAGRRPRPLVRPALERRRAERERDAASSPSDHADVEHEAPPYGPPARHLRERVVGVGQRQERRDDPQPRRPCPSRATKSPQSRNCGSTIAGMNCTAWNSRRRERAHEQPERHPERRVRRPRARRPPTRGPATSSPSSPKASTETTVACTTASSANATRVAGEQVELRERHRHQPLERPGRPLAQHRHRRHDEHRDEREEAEQRRAHVLEDLRPPPEELLQQRLEHARHADDERRSSAGRAAAA